MYKDVQQFERLLRAIYRPHNFYCVHVDRNSTDDVHRGIAAVTSCFHNVYVPADVVDVKWGMFSVVEAEIICLRHLLRKKKWRYNCMRQCSYTIEKVVGVHASI